ncbi:conserved hypothetical protein, partial [Ricinus communis]
FVPRRRLREIVDHPRFDAGRTDRLQRGARRAATGIVKNRDVHLENPCSRGKDDTDAAATLPVFLLVRPLVAL